LRIHGTADKAAKSSGSQLSYEKAGSTDKTLNLYDGGYHELLNDLGKEQVMEMPKAGYRRVSPTLGAPHPVCRRRSFGLHVDDFVALDWGLV
jgi:hypothetical protein